MQKLETYNRIVLAVLGTVALGAMAIGAGALTYEWLRGRVQALKARSASQEAPAGGASAGNPTAPATATEDPTANSRETPAYGFGRPIFLKGTDSVLIPVINEDSLPASVWSRSADDTERPRADNLLFHDVAKGTHRTLLPEGGIVVGYAPLVSEGSAGTTLGVLCSVIERDTNHDGSLEEDDAEATYLVAPAGTPLRRLGPDGARLFDWSLDAAHGQLVLIFKSADGRAPMRIYRAALGSTDRGSEVLDDSTKKSMLRAARPAPTPEP